MAHGRLLVALVALAMVACRAGETDVPPLSDSQAREVIEKNWNSLPSWLSVGELQVVQGRDDPQNNRISESTAKDYAAWQEAGVLTVTTVRDLTKGFTGWNDWMRLYGEGVKAIINVAPTERGLKVGHVPNPGTFVYQPAQYRVKRIVRNSPVVKEFDQYRVVLGTHSASFAPEIKAAYEKLGRSTATDRKFIVLLWFDPFDSQWKAGAEDIASEKAFFTTDRVHDFLASR